MNFTHDSIRKLEEDAIAAQVPLVTIAVGYLKANFTGDYAQMFAEFGLPEDVNEWTVENYTSLMTRPEVAANLPPEAAEAARILLGMLENNFNQHVTVQQWATMLAEMDIQDPSVLQELAQAFASEAEDQVLELSSPSDEPKFTSEEEVEEVEDVAQQINDRVVAEISKLMKPQEGS